MQSAMPNEPRPNEPRPIEPLPNAPMAAELAARWLGVVLPDECSDGVAINLALLADHVARVRASLDDLD